MKFRNKYNIDLFQNPLKRNIALIEKKNKLESDWYDLESQSAYGQLNERAGLLPMDQEFELWFGNLYDNSGVSMPYDRDYAFFSLFRGSRGNRFLELGFGNGCLSRFFIRRGIAVHSVDVSYRYCQFLKATEIKSLPLKSCAEFLPYKSNSFDIVTTFLALHHFNLDCTIPEIYRVLRPGGRGIFIEPLANSKLLYYLRQYIPVKDNESPGGGGLITSEIVAKLKAAGFGYNIREFELFTRLERLPLLRYFQRYLRWFDNRILAIAPPLKFLARTAVIEVIKE